MRHQNIWIETKIIDTVFDHFETTILRISIIIIIVIIIKMITIITLKIIKKSNILVILNKESLN